MNAKRQEERKQLTLSICIVNWETRDLLRACLASLRQHPLGRGRAEIVVVDNASRDGSRDMVEREFTDVKLIANRDNVGFARANNQAVEAATGDLVMLLNPDAEVVEGSLDAIVEFMEHHPDAGAAACQLLNPDGSIQPSCRGFPRPRDILFDRLARCGLVRRRSAPLSRYRMSHFGHDAETQIDFAMAAALCVRRHVWDHLGGMDDANFPLYYNDTDFCYRLWQAGWAVYFTPSARVLHRLGASTGMVPETKIRDGHDGLVRFYRKHFLRQSPIASRIVIAMTSLHKHWALAMHRSRSGRGGESASK